MSSVTPREHVRNYMWEIGDDGRTAIVGHGQQWHVLMAADTFNTLTDAIRRLAEIEAAFTNGQIDRPSYVTDLIIAAEHVLPFARAVCPTTIVSALEDALQRARPK